MPEFSFQQLVDGGAAVKRAQLSGAPEGGTAWVWVVVGLIGILVVPSLIRRRTSVTKEPAISIAPPPVSSPVSPHIPAALKDLDREMETI